MDVYQLRESSDVHNPLAVRRQHTFVEHAEDKGGLAAGGIHFVVTAFGGPAGLALGCRERRTLFGRRVKRGVAQRKVQGAARQQRRVQGRVPQLDAGADVRIFIEHRLRVCERVGVDVGADHGPLGVHGTAQARVDRDAPCANVPSVHLVVRRTVDGMQRPHYVLDPQHIVQAVRQRRAQAVVAERRPDRKVAQEQRAGDGTQRRRIVPIHLRLAPALVHKRREARIRPRQRAEVQRRRVAIAGMHQPPQPWPSQGSGGARRSLRCSLRRAARPAARPALPRTPLPATAARRGRRTP